MRIVSLNPRYLQYENDLRIPRPQAIPFNVICMGKVYAAGYSDGITMIIFKNENEKPASQINYFRMVPKAFVDALVTGNRQDIIEKFVDQAINGLYPVYIEDNPNYFL